MSGDRSSGFTLVELLVALSIAALVAGIVWIALSVSSRAVATLLERTGTARLSATAASRIEADLTAMFVPAGDLSCALALSSTPFSVSFCAVFSEGRAEEWLWGNPYRVHYALKGSDEDNRDLIRVLTPLSGSIRAATNIVARRVRFLELQLHDGSTWYSNWPPDSGSTIVPRAARLSLLLQGMSAPHEAVWWLPAGHVASNRSDSPISGGL
ncbi:MAG: prepilin-type N-terminal cleavage/methylation domain-containing protein [Kiritimatiellae bacterium]|nr:prepilin-type N-terminal cleavage/methylation domain-containing protein [Kiritimatiellia bacterium]MDW8458003.1 prepilin-type N-terminal cleavage/methylation domain-containing protein [Verrucomicrobiota bacterium]